MHHLASMLASSSPDESTMAQQKAHVSYTLPLPLDAPHPEEVTLLESRSLISSTGTTGLRTWEGALHLAHYLMSDAGKPWVQSRTILELGAGTGLVSLVCAKHLGARRVMATDGGKGVVEDMETNFRTSGLEPPGDIRSSVLRWGWKLSDDLFDQSSDVKSFDVVLGADIVSREL